MRFSDISPDEKRVNSVFGVTDGEEEEGKEEAVGRDERGRGKACRDGFDVAPVGLRLTSHC